ncbi:MAG: hypothetical protein U1E53_22460 [Dongiaceae bacterium]
MRAESTLRQGSAWTASATAGDRQSASVRASPASSFARSSGAAASTSLTKVAAVRGEKNSTQLKPPSRSRMRVSAESRSAGFAS